MLAQHTARALSFNTFQLVKPEETKNAYQQQLHKNLCEMGRNSCEDIRASITYAATKTIGFTKNNKNHTQPCCRTIIKPAEGTSSSY